MSDHPGPRYLAAMHAGFRLAGQLNRAPGPVHFLVGIAEGDGPAADALRPPGPLALSAAAAACAVPAGGTRYLHAQAQEAARQWADSRGEQVEPEHLLVALLDQGAPDVNEALRLAGVDAGQVRGDVLTALGAPADLPAIPLPPPAAAGIYDRPALPVTELPLELWSQLQWRQDHLPLRRLRRPADWTGLYHLERRAAWRLAARSDVDDDARCSLQVHHNQEVQRRAAQAAPHVVPAPAEPSDDRPQGVMVQRVFSRRRIRLRVPNMFVGWPTWFKNRAVNLNAAWFKFTTLHYYRGQPRATHPR